MSKYGRFVYWSDVDQMFIVEVPELPGCMADGTTIADAIANSEIIIQEWLEVAADRGQVIPEPMGRIEYS